MATPARLTRQYHKADVLVRNIRDPVLSDLRASDYPGSIITLEGLRSYLIDLYQQEQILTAAAAARQQHYELYTKGSEDEGHRHARLTINGYAAECREMLAYYTALECELILNDIQITPTLRVEQQDCPTKSKSRVVQAAAPVVNKSKRGRRQKTKPRAPKHFVRTTKVDNTIDDWYDPQTPTADDIITLFLRPVIEHDVQFWLNIPFMIKLNSNIRRLNADDIYLEMVDSELVAISYMYIDGLEYVANLAEERNDNYFMKNATSEQDIKLLKHMDITTAVNWYFQQLLRSFPGKTDSLSAKFILWLLLQYSHFGDRFAWARLVLRQLLTNTDSIIFLNISLVQIITKHLLIEKVDGVYQLTANYEQLNDDMINYLNDYDTRYTRSLALLSNRYKGHNYFGFVDEVSRARYLEDPNFIARHMYKSNGRQMPLNTQITLQSIDLWRHIISPAIEKWESNTQMIEEDQRFYHSYAYLSLRLMFMVSNVGPIYGKMVDDSHLLALARRRGKEVAMAYDDIDTLLVAIYVNLYGYAP